MAHYGGYLAFGKLVGYHKGLWIDTPQDAFIGFHQHKTIPPLSRHLQLDYPRKVRRFNMVLHDSFLKYKVYSHITSIHQLEVSPLSYHHVRAFEILDNIIVKLMKKSDKKRRSKITNKVILQYTA